MFLLIIYEIENSTARKRFHRMLKNFGTCVQKSVFECNLSHAQERKLRQEISAFVGKLGEEDTIRIFSLCQHCFKNAAIIGKTPLTQEPLYYLV